MIPVQTYDPKKGKFVLAGMLEGDVFHKDCRKKAHYMVVYRGYGIQQDVILALQRREVKKVVIETKKEILTSNLQDWLDHGVFDNNIRAHGQQIFLEANLMQSELKNAKKKL